jgi:hypothetical protein
MVWKEKYILQVISKTLLMSDVIGENEETLRM